MLPEFLDLPDLPQNELLIGVDFPIAIHQIACGRVSLDRVNFVVTQRLYESEREWVADLDRYCQTYWSYVELASLRCREIANILRDSGKLKRASKEGRLPIMSPPHQCWVSSPDEIQWSDYKRHLAPIDNREWFNWQVQRILPHYKNFMTRQTIEEVLMKNPLMWLP